MTSTDPPGIASISDRSTGRSWPIRCPGGLEEALAEGIPFVIDTNRGPPGMASNRPLSADPFRSNDENSSYIFTRLIEMSNDTGTDLEGPHYRRTTLWLVHLGHFDRLGTTPRMKSAYCRGFTIPRAF